MKLMRRVNTFLLCVTASALVQIATVPNASAGSILGGDASAFALLGGAGVQVNGTGSVITGSVGGCCNAVAVTGYPAMFTDSGGTVYVNPPFSTLPTATETLAQAELGAAITALSGMTPVTSIASLNGLTLGPGVYSIPATTLTGTLTLDGGGNANALWVFLESSSLTTASSSNVIVQGTGAGAGVYWVMAAGSATLGSNSVFEGNILANEMIGVGTNVTDPCGRLLTQVAGVTLAGMDTIGIGCSGILAGSNGLGGGGTLSMVNGAPVVTSLAFSAVPEPSTFFLLVPCLAGLVILRKRLRSKLA
jgi:hypothetical protein